jgi:hypothetical protein
MIMASFRATATHAFLAPMRLVSFTPRNAIIHNGVLDPGVNFIAKPFSLEALAQKLRHVFDETASAR